jgi:hypothetical protein
MSEFMLIMSQDQTGQGPTPRPRPQWPPYPASDDPATIMLRMLACLRDLDRIEARLSAAYLETAIQHLRGQFDLDGDSSETE